MLLPRVGFSENRVFRRLKTFNLEWTHHCKDSLRETYAFAKSWLLGESRLPASEDIQPRVKPPLQRQLEGASIRPRNTSIASGLSASTRKFIIISFTNRHFPIIQYVVCSVLLPPANSLYAVGFP